MARLSRAWIGYLLILAIQTASLAQADDKYCVVEAKLESGGDVRLEGDVTVPVPATLRNSLEGSLYGTIAIVFPTGEEQGEHATMLLSASTPRANHYRGLASMHQPMACSSSTLQGCSHICMSASNTSLNVVLIPLMLA